VTGTLICETHALVPAFTRTIRSSASFLATALEAGLKYEFSSEPTIEALKQMLRSSGFTKVDIKHTPSMRWLKKIKAAITTRPAVGPPDRPRAVAAMRAVVLDRDTLAHRTDYPQPTPLAGEVLVRVLRAGICETDLQLIRGYMGFSGVLGHEFVASPSRVR